MSGSAVDYADLLREAIKQAKANAPRSVDDLHRIASQATDAVGGVTGGAAVLELVPINLGEEANPTYQLQLRKVGSEAPPSDLGVYAVSGAGYPIRRWYSRGLWETRIAPPTEIYNNVGELEVHFRWLVSNPESRLVMLATYFQLQLSSHANSTSGD